MDYPHFGAEAFRQGFGDQIMQTDQHISECHGLLGCDGVGMQISIHVSPAQADDDWLLRKAVVELPDALGAAPGMQRNQEIGPGTLKGCRYRHAMTEIPKDSCPTIGCGSIA
jgi:hypothetical protein